MSFSTNRNSPRKNSKASKNENVVLLPSQAVAFGRDYFHALGGTQEKIVYHYDDVTNEPHPLQAFAWEEPPWRPANAHRPNAAAASNKRNKKHNKKQQQSAESSEPANLDEYDVQEAACTAQSTVFLTRTGKVYQTGTFHGRVMTSPTAVEIPLPLNCVEVSAGRHFCLGRMEGGLAVVSWGAGHFGQLGVGSRGSGGGGGDGSSSSGGGSSLVTFTPHPVVIERLLPHVIGSSILSVAAGDWHALALTESGRVWAWGSNRNLQCGRKHHHHSSSKPHSAPTSSGGSAPTITMPLPVPLEVSASQIKAGRAHSVAVDRDSGQVYCWGSSNHGQCGNSVRRSGIAPPRLVEGMADLSIAQIEAAGNHTMALTTGGRLFVWGAGSEGQLGLGPAVPSQCRPRLVADLDFVAVAAGQEWKSQQLRARLADEQGSSSISPSQSGSPKADAGEPPSSPRPKSPPPPLAPNDLARIPRIKSIFAGASYSAAVSTSGHVYIWGSNDAGQIGVPTPKVVPLVDGYHQRDSGQSSLRDLHVRTFDSRHNILLPVRMDAVADMNVRLLACGPNHLWCIGENRPANEQVIVGRTLYELQEGQRVKKLLRARESFRAGPGLSKRQSADEDEGDYTETSHDAYTLSSIPPSTPETSIQTMSNPELATQLLQTPDLGDRSKIKSPKSEKQKRAGLIKRFSWRKVITRMSSSNKSDNNKSDKEDTDNHQSDMNDSNRKDRRRIISREVST